MVPLGADATILTGQGRMPESAKKKPSYTITATAIPAQAVNDLLAHQAFIVGNDGGGGAQGVHAGTRPIRLAVWLGRFRRAL